MKLRVIFPLAAILMTILVSGQAAANHCPPGPGNSTGGGDWCHDDGTSPQPPPNISPQPTPASPQPTTSPSTTASAAPTTKAPTGTAAPSTSRPRQTVEPVEVPTQTGPTNTPSIIIPSPLGGDTELIENGDSNSGGVAQNMAFFIVGFILGAIVGRASWGFSRKRKKQHIFG